MCQSKGQRADAINILIVGFPFVIHKHVYLAEELSKYGVTSVFYTPDRHGLSYKVSEMPGVELERSPDSIVHDFINFIRTLLRYRPKHVQVSFGRRLTMYVFLSWLLGFPVVVACQGGEIMYWNLQGNIKRLLHTLCFRLSKLVIVNELYMAEAIRRHRIVEPSRLFFFHNRVRVRPNIKLHREGKVVLYLNVFKHWRHPELVVEAAPYILSRVPDAEILLVGETREGPARERIEQMVRQRITELGLTDKVRCLPFTTEPWKYYERASVFVLPADIVFCNFALLEAMERGVPPVVAQVDGADRIVEHGKSGFVVPQTPEAIAQAVIALLTDEDLRYKMGQGARQKVIEGFDIREGAQIILNLYRERVWYEG